MTDQKLPEGVSWHPAIQRWRVDVKVGRKTVYLGSEHTIEKAAQLYLDKKDAVIAMHIKEAVQEKESEERTHF